MDQVCSVPIAPLCGTLGALMMLNRPLASLVLRLPLVPLVLRRLLVHPVFSESDQAGPRQVVAVRSR